MFINQRRLISTILIILFTTVVLSYCAVPNVETPYDKDNDSSTNLSSQTGGNVDNSSTDAFSSTNSSTVQTSTEPENKETRLKFLAAGDNIIHSSIYDDAMKRAKNGETYNFIDMYEGVSDLIKNVDIAFVNQETPIAGEEFQISGYPMFNTPKEAVYALIELGFDIFNIANNHMLDQREKGYRNQLEFWKRQPIMMIGGYENAADYENIRVYEKDGITIAFISYTYGTNGMYLPNGSEMVVPYDKDKDVIVRHIKAAKKKADLVFAVMHWGNEDEFTANYTQRDLAQTMVDNGVDVIIGMHPHVLQEVKWVNRPDGGKTLIAYSLGNFISTMEPARNMVGALMQFDIVKNNNGIFIENAEIIPVMTHYNMSRRGLQVYRFEDYTKEMASGHGSQLKDSKFSYSYLKKLITDIIDPQFLSEFYSVAIN